MITPLFSAGRVIPVGCVAEDGNLRPEYGVEYIGEAPAGVVCAGYSAGANRYLVATEEYVYVSPDLNSFTDIAPQNALNPFFLEQITGETTYAVMVRGGVAVMHGGTGFTSAILSEALSCGVMHCGRLFGAKQEGTPRIVWSGEGGVSDWESKLYGAGYLRPDTARGEVLDVAEYGERLAIVRKYGLDFMRAYGTPENFALEASGRDFGEILKGTAKAAGGVLYFCTERGLYAFDGEIREVSHALKGDAEYVGCAAVYENRYFVKCRSKSLDRKVMLCYDPDGGSAFYVDCAPDFALAADGRLYFFCGDGLYALCRGKSYCVTVKDIDFSTGRKKTLKEVYLGCGGVSLSVAADGKKRAFQNARGEVKTSLRGGIFTVEINGNCPISGAKLITEATIGI